MDISKIKQRNQTEDDTSEARDLLYFRGICAVTQSNNKSGEKEG